MKKCGSIKKLAAGKRHLLIKKTFVKVSRLAGRVKTTRTILCEVLEETLQGSKTKRILVDSWIDSISTEIRQSFSVVIPRFAGNKADYS